MSFFVAAALCICCGCGKADSRGDKILAIDAEIVEASNIPLVGRDHPGSSGNVDGYENGYILKHEDGTYHMLVTEMYVDGGLYGQGSWSPARIGHWISEDGEDWTRRDTVVEGNGIAYDPKENTWSATYFWNETEDAWNIYWRGHGSVFRYRSTEKGRSGISGPYEEVSVIWKNNTIYGEQTWDGGFFASFGNVYQAKDGRYYSFYCGGAAMNGDNNWACGLAVAKSPEGPWYRYAGSPWPVFYYCENPMVYVYDGVYYCVFDDLSEQKSIGLGYSEDGIHWKAKYIDLTDHCDWSAANWYVQSVRTPMGLIREEDGTFAIHFTAFDAAQRYYSIGKIKIKISPKYVKDRSAEQIEFDDEHFRRLAGEWHREYWELSCNNAGGEVFALNALNRNFSEGFTLETALRCVDKSPLGERETRAGIFFGLNSKTGGYDENAFSVLVDAGQNVTLYRGREPLAQSRMKTPPYLHKTLKLTVSGKTVKVYFEDSETPCIEQTLADYAGGSAGLIAGRSHWHFRELYLYE